MLGSVYGIVNKRNGKAYIGSTGRDARLRWNEHLWKLRCGKASPYLQNVWDKYGSDAFQFRILETDVPVDHLTEREQYWIDNWPDGIYNVGKVADPPNRGRKFSLEARQRISEGHKRWFASLSKEQRRQFVKAAQQAASSPDVRRRAAETLRGFRHSDATKRQMSRSAKGRKASVETRTNMSRAQRGRNNLRYGVELSADLKERMGVDKAKPYPPFVNISTGELIPVGLNLCKLCRERGLTQSAMWRLIRGLQKSHKGWALVQPGGK